MKLIINASGTKATGATQVTVSFIRECMKFSQHDYYLFLSKTVMCHLESTILPDNFFITVFDHKPFFTKKGLETWRKLILLEEAIKPDCVFSVFGPSVWQPNAPHLMGYAYPYYIYPESPFFKVITSKLSLKISLHKAFHKFFFQKNGKHFVCETQDVSNRLTNYIRCNPNNIYTVTNTYNDFFNDFQPDVRRVLKVKKQNEFRFLTLSSFATHKNLRILNDIIPILRKKLSDIEVKFVLTLNKDEFENNFSKEAKDQIVNIGRVKSEECPQVYYECDALFLPTLMECFSASYAEAMIMGKPILTSDLAFAHTVCEDAALYFDPIEPEDIVEKIILLIRDQNFQNRLINLGYERVKIFDTAQTRAKKYLEICENISRHGNS